MRRLLTLIAVSTAMLFGSVSTADATILYQQPMCNYYGGSWCDSYLSNGEAMWMCAVASRMEWNSLPTTYGETYTVYDRINATAAWVRWRWNGGLGWISLTRCKVDQDWFIDHRVVTAYTLAG